MNSSLGPRSPDITLQLPNKKVQKRSFITELGGRSKKQSVNPTTSVAKGSLKILSANKFFAAFHEQTNEIRAFRIQEISQLLREACQQLEKMLSGIADASTIALKILSNLDRTQIVLLFSTTVLTGHDSFALVDWSNSEDWKDEEKSAFYYKFTRLVPGSWNEGGILNRWEELFKILIDDIDIWSSEACSMNFLEVARDDFDKYDYRKELGMLEHQNKHRLCQAKKMEKKGRSENDI